MQKKLFLVLAALGALAITGCSCNQRSQRTYPQLDPLAGETIADFSEGLSDEFFASDGWSNGMPFNCVWKGETITHSDGKLHLGIKKGPARDGDKEYPYIASEYRSHKLYGYGDYEVRMKPVKQPGVISTFFVITNEWTVTDGEANPWDEIDIEFVGKDTTKVQFNYYAHAKQGENNPHEHMYDLGFDASLEFHDYGFRWEEDKISWFVDGKTVYQVILGTKVDGQDHSVLPTYPGRIMLSCWPWEGKKTIFDPQGWGGNFTGPTDKTADYEWVKSSAQSRYADGEEPVPPFDANVNWEEATQADVNFTTWDHYTISKENDVHTFTYDQAGAWTQVVANDAAKYANKGDLVKVTLKNNTENEAKVRMDIKGTNTVQTATGSTDCLNVMARAEGHDELETNLEWGGTSLTLRGNEEVDLVVKYDTSTSKGLATALLFFLDSMQNDVVAHPGSSISVKNIRFANSDGTPVNPDDPVDPPVDPDEDAPDGPYQPDPADETWDPIAAEDLTFNSSGAYTVSKQNGVSEVTYEQVGAWANVSAEIGTIAADKDAVRVTLTNRKKTESNIRIDVKGTTTVGNTDCLNESMVAVNGGHSEIHTDDNYGGSFATLAGGERATFMIEYKTDTERGLPTHLLIYMDSMQADTVAHKGKIQISNVKFANLHGGDTPQPENAYFLVGTFNNWQINNGYKFALEEGSADKYVLNDIQIAAQDELKVRNPSLGDNGWYTNASPWDDCGFTLAENGNIIVSEAGKYTVEFYLNGENNNHVVLKKQSEPVDPADPVWDPIAAEDLTFNNSGPYTIAKENGVSTITYTSANNWANVSAEIGTIAGSKDTVRITLENKSTTASNVRVDVKGTNSIDTTDQDGQSATDCLNVKAEAAGHSEINTDTKWGGSTLVVAANEKVHLVITYDVNTAKGAPTHLLVYMDSMQGDPVAKSDGCFVIHDVKFAKLGEDVSTPTYYLVGTFTETPWTAVEAYKFSKTDNENKFVLSNVTFIEQAAMQVKDTTQGENEGWFTNAATWDNCGFTLDDDKNVVLQAGTYDIEFYVVGENNNHIVPVVKTPVEQKDYHLVGDFNTWNKDDASRPLTRVDDNHYKIDNVQFAAGEAFKVVTLDPETWYGTAEAWENCGFTKSEEGNVIVTLAGAYTVNLWLSADNGNYITITRDMSFGGNLDAYTVSPAETPTDSVNVTYADLSGKSYFNIGAGSGDVTGATKFIVKITNNGSVDVKIRMDIKNAAEEDIVTSYSINGGEAQAPDHQWGNNTTFTVGAGQTITIVLTIDQVNLGAANYVMFFLDSSTWDDEGTHSGNVTLSDFMFA